MKLFIHGTLVVLPTIHKGLVVVYKEKPVGNDNDDNTRK